MRRRNTNSRNDKWQRIQHLFPHPTHDGGRGHPWNPHRPLVNAILWICHTGAPPGVTFPNATAPGRPPTTASAAGAKTVPRVRLVTHLLNHLERHGRIGPSPLVCRCHHRPCQPGLPPGAEHDPDPDAGLGVAPRPGATDGARRPCGWATPAAATAPRVRTCCATSHGLPLGSLPDPGAAARMQKAAFAPLMDHVLVPVGEARAQSLAGAVGGGQGLQLPRGAGVVEGPRVGSSHPNPQRTSPGRSRFDKEGVSGPQRDRAAACVGWLKERRRLGTRYDKLAVSFLAFWMVGIMDLLLDYN